MAAMPDSLLLCVSSPYALRGALWEAYHWHYGQDGDSILVWQADTRSMNPSVDPKVIADAYERDESAAAAEYGAEFRSDIESFVSVEAVDAVTMPGRFELPPMQEFNYVAFCDPSGGSVDSMTLAVAHHENGRAVLGLVRGKRPPVSPEAVVQEFAEVLRAYQVTTVTGDRYAGEWPREQFRKHGIEYLPSEKAKSELYLELLPAINSGQVDLLDNSRLLAQLRGLERRTSRVGRDVVDHGPGALDDLINAVAGALVCALAMDSAPFCVVL